jgi:hypothetical protein
VITNRGRVRVPSPRGVVQERSGDQFVREMRRWPVTSVMGSLEERQVTARVRGEEHRSSQLST